MEYVNQHATPGAVIAVAIPLYPARTFARPDLEVRMAPTQTSPDFALVCDEQNVMDSFYPDLATVYVIGSDGVALAEVKQRSPSASSGTGSP